MTERENYLKVLNGEKPEWVPYYRDACDWVIPWITTSYLATEEKVDFLGVHWVMDDAGPMADTRRLALDDISKWRDVVHLPDVESFDWEKYAAFDLREHDPDKAIAIMPGLGGGCFFIPLMNMMGFSEGLCAMFEEEEEVKALFDHFMEWYEKLLPKCIEYYHPDVVIMGDDICTANGPFIGRDVYESLIRPYFRKCISICKNAGVKFELHMCGKCESFIDDFVEMGIDIWEPAQPLNDLAAIKKKYGNRLVLNGAWFTAGPGGVPGAPEHIGRREARECIDRYAPGGGYVFWDGDPVGTSEDMKRKIGWLADEARTYGKAFYKEKNV